MSSMNSAIEKFVFAHDRYLALADVRTQCGSPVEREQMHIEIMRAYLEVHYRARVIAGLQYAEGMDFAEVQ
jgi:hypothetical protein